MMENFEQILQLFAEAAEGDTAHFTGENEADAAPQASGEENTPAAGVESDRSSAFEALIKGEFKAEYDARVRDTVQKRLRSQKEQTRILEALTPALNKLAQFHGIDPKDIPAMTQVLEAETEHFSQALAQATAQLEKALASKLAAAQNRPAENGIGAGSAAAIRNDVSQMTRQDRADIIRRVREGETIRF